MRLVVTGGGTGGHIYPALAVAEHLRADPAVGENNVFYLGKTGGMESDLAATANIPFYGLSFYGMPRGKNPLIIPKMLSWGVHLYQARGKAINLLKELKPDVIFGTGGYVSAPVLLAASALKIPYAVHEPDAQPGLANRLMAKGAALITTSFSEGAEKLRQSPSQQVLVTGNPIRGHIGHLDKGAVKASLSERWQTLWPTERPILLVTGGSQGSRRINTAVVDALPTLINECSMAVIHLTGRKLYDETLAMLDAIDPALKTNPAYRVAAYEFDMASMLAIADLAVCRAGSLSLSEMYVSGIPTLLIPYPFAASDHQRKNAQASVRAGASRYIEDSECTGERLLTELRPLLDNPSQRNAMRQSALGLGHPHATHEIAEALKALAEA